MEDPITDAELDELGIRPCAYRFDTSDIRVEWRGGATGWAIVDGGLCLNSAGEWEHEPLPSSRDEEFFQRCRFTLDDALRRANAIVRKT